MRKLTLFTGAMLVVALALISGLSNAKPAWALCWCPTNNDYVTSMHWGMGSSCTAAHNDLLAQVNQEASADCGGVTKTCFGALVVTTSCHYEDGMYVEDGYKEYSCKVCEIPQA